MSDLSHVFWLGGGTGGGKSTVARHLAERFAVRLYDTDRAMADHTARSSPGDTPYLQRFLAMDMDERWADRSPETMLETFHWFRGEAFDLIVDDLLRLPPEPIVVEGFRLLPALVEPLLADRRQGVWLLPTPEFRRMAVEQRGSLWAIAGRTHAPERALGNLLERDRRFTEQVAVETRRLGLTSVVVDGSRTEDEVTLRVAGLFGLGRPG
ncbi:hypothetical protein E0H73_01175 [Kribbella pittospori]|uniref:Uncharacterized protein n=1 Tax=Kribbella pittospori TaxID=722689 RepID=A0A4R0KY35_9ACTN|nr:hypothetical protein [Kribbella pittospori]TCC65580.1 hypothetical protein E0H73_01175 [Kribbella pittospori]